MFAQLYGADDMHHFRLEHYQMLAVGTAASAVLAAGGLHILPSLIRLMRTPSDMIPYVTQYLILILLGLPLTYLYNYYNGLLRSVGNVRVPLYILAGATILNLILDYLLVGALSLGTRGAAATSVIAAQAYGAGAGERVRRTFVSSGRLLLSFGLLCSAFLWLTAPVTSAFMLSGAGGNAFRQAAGYLRMISIFYPLCFLGNTFAGYFDGIGKPQIPFVGASSHITLRVILSFLWLPGGSLPALALATGIGWLWVNLFWTFLYLRTVRVSGIDAPRLPA